MFSVCRTTEIDIDHLDEENEQTISLPDPSMINEPVVNDYVIPSEREEDSLVEEPPSVESDTETDKEWEVIENRRERKNLNLSTEMDIHMGQVGLEMKHGIGPVLSDTKM